jgi:transcriptional regulator NrdR family protein
MIACSICGARTSVRETRSHGNYIRRRRYCDNTACIGKLTTIEIAAPEFHHDEALVIITRRELEALAQALGRVLVRATQ